MVLSTFMLYTAFAGEDVREPVLQVAELGAHERVARRELVQLDGVAAGPVTGDKGERIEFFATDRKGNHKTRIVYEGSVPDAFRVGRQVIVKGSLEGTGAQQRFVAKPGSLVTKCPSKFETEGGSGRSSS